MTVHNAKGLEFRHVYVTGLEEGLFPHMSAYRDDEELEEERRLFYVACTRAMDRLRLSAAHDRRRTNRVFDGGVSRFLGEIPDHLIETVSFSGEGSASPRGASTARERFAGWDEEDEVITYDDPLVGHLVLHPTFGKGLVLHVDGAGDAARVTVRFPRTGPKKVIRSYLRVVEGDGP
jgi:DNA helicase-2/ATP-dependent DNA helicase PcrA